MQYFVEHIDGPDNADQQIVLLIIEVRNGVIYNIECYTADSSTYLISGIFRVGLIFAEFVTSSKSLKMHTAKRRLCNKISIDSPSNCENRTK